MELGEQGQLLENKDLAERKNRRESKSQPGKGKKQFLQRQEEEEQ